MDVWKAKRLRAFRRIQLMKDKLGTHKIASLYEDLPKKKRATWSDV